MTDRRQRPRNARRSHDEPTAMRRIAVAVLLMAALAGCGQSVDSWIEDQAGKLADKGVTFPPGQARFAIINVVSVCVMKATGNDTGREASIFAIRSQADWVSAVDAGIMYDFATPEFCDSVPDAPLGRS